MDATLLSSAIAERNLMDYQSYGFKSKLDYLLKYLGAMDFSLLGLIVQVLYPAQVSPRWGRTLPSLQCRSGYTLRYQMDARLTDVASRFWQLAPTPTVWNPNTYLVDITIENLVSTGLVKRTLPVPNDPNHELFESTYAHLKVTELGKKVFVAFTGNVANNLKVTLNQQIILSAIPFYSPVDRKELKQTSQLPSKQFTPALNQLVERQMVARYRDCFIVTPKGIKALRLQDFWNPLTKRFSQEGEQQ